MLDPIELEPSSGLTPAADLRRLMDEPPPVRLIAVEDVRLVAPPGAVDALEVFYAGLLEFVRDPVAVVFRAENFRLRFEIVDQIPVEHDGVRPVGIQVRSLRDMEQKLFENRIDYQRQRGLLPGMISLLLQDPAGNWIELVEAIAVG